MAPRFRRRSSLRSSRGCRPSRSPGTASVATRADPGNGFRLGAEIRSSISAPSDHEGTRRSPALVPTDIAGRIQVIVDPAQVRPNIDDTWDRGRRVLEVGNSASPPDGSLKADGGGGDLDIDLSGV